MVTEEVQSFKRPGKGTEAHRHRVRKTEFLNPKLCAFVPLCLFGEVLR